MCVCACVGACVFVCEWVSVCMCEGACVWVLACVYGCVCGVCVCVCVCCVCLGVYVGSCVVSFTRYKMQETLFNVGYKIIGNISSSELFSDKTRVKQ